MVSPNPSLVLAADPAVFQAFWNQTLTGTVTIPPKICWPHCMHFCWMSRSRQDDAATLWRVLFLNICSGFWWNLGKRGNTYFLRALYVPNTDPTPYPYKGRILAEKGRRNAYKNTYLFRIFSALGSMLSLAVLQKKSWASAVRISRWFWNLEKTQWLEAAIGCEMLWASVHVLFTWSL